MRTSQRPRDLLLPPVVNIKHVAAVTVVVLCLFAVAAFAKVVKTSFVSGDLFITGSSKTTGNGSQYTVCDYFDADTGAFVDELQQAGIGFDNEANLQAFCDENRP